MRILIFKTMPEIDRPHILAIPEDKITKIESQVGSENCYCKVNGMRVDASFDEVIRLLGDGVRV